MQKLKRQIEGQLQEIVFFFSLLLAFTVFISGAFYLALSPNTILYILGTFGSSLNQALFSVYGLAFFYFSGVALHMGHVTNTHVYNFKDFKNEYQVLSYSFIAHIIILTLLSISLSVVQIYFNISSSELLPNGIGGVVGYALGQLFYSGLGVYGSLILLILVMFMTSIMAGFFELKDVQELIKASALTAKIYFFKSLKTINNLALQFIDFILKDHDMTPAHVNFSHSKNWMSQSFSKANSFFTDHFHINTNILTGSTISEDKKAVDKKCIRKKTSKISILKSKSKEAQSFKKTSAKSTKTTVKAPVNAKTTKVKTTVKKNK